MIRPGHDRIGHQLSEHGAHGYEIEPEHVRDGQQCGELDIPAIEETVDRGAADACAVDDVGDGEPLAFALFLQGASKVRSSGYRVFS